MLQKFSCFPFLRTRLSFEFRASNPSGVLLYTANAKQADFIECHLEDGRVSCSFSAGGGILKLYSVHANYADGNWHSVSSFQRVTDLCHGLVDYSFLHFWTNLFRRHFKIFRLSEFKIIMSKAVTKGIVPEEIQAWLNQISTQESVMGTLSKDNNDACENVV